MSTLSANARKGFTVIELAVLLVIIVATSSAVFCILHDKSAVLSAHETELLIHEAAKKAYSTSIELEKIGESEARTELDGCSIVNMNGAWYLVCNLYELTGGSNAVEKIIIQDFAKKHAAAGLTPSYDEENNIALFLRFASEKKTLPSNYTGDFVNNWQYNAQSSPEL